MNIEPAFRVTAAFFIWSISLLCHGQWTLVPSGTTAKLYDVMFPSFSTGYTVGSEGTIVKSIDNGLTWAVIAGDSTHDYVSVHFLSDTKGFVAGQSASGFPWGGILRMTEDGGATWQTVATEPDNWLPRVHFATDLLGYYTCRYGRVMRTTDGGLSWATALDSSFLEVANLIACPTPDTCIFWGGPGFTGPPFRTTDGGNTFEEMTGAFQSIKEALFFVNANVGFMSGWYNDGFVKTTDGGSTWSILQYDAAWDIHFVNENEGWYCNGYFGGARIYHSLDGGITWANQLDTTGGLLAMDFMDELTGIAVGSNGAIYRTQNGGTTGISTTSASSGTMVVYDAAARVLRIQRSAPMEGEMFGLTDAIGRTVVNVRLPVSTTVELPAGRSASGLHLYSIAGNDGRKTSGTVLITD